MPTLVNSSGCFAQSIFMKLRPSQIRVASLGVVVRFAFAWSLLADGIAWESVLPWSPGRCIFLTCKS